MLYVLVFKCHCSTNPEDKLFIIYFALIFVFHFFFVQLCGAIFCYYHLHANNKRRNVEFWILLLRNSFCFFVFLKKKKDLSKSTS